MRSRRRLKIFKWRVTEGKASFSGGFSQVTENARPNVIFLDSVKESIED